MIARLVGAPILGAMIGLILGYAIFTVSSGLGDFSAWEASVLSGEGYESYFWLVAGIVSTSAVVLMMPRS